MKKLIIGLFLGLLMMVSPMLNVQGEEEPDCCSDCCRWSELFGDCMATGTGAYCLDVKMGSYCQACVVVTPKK